MSENPYEAPKRLSLPPSGKSDNWYAALAGFIIFFGITTPIVAVVLAIWLADWLGLIP